MTGCMSGDILMWSASEDFEFQIVQINPLRQILKPITTILLEREESLGA